MDSTKVPANKDVIWAISSSLKEFKASLSSQYEVISIPSHLKDGTSSTELLSIIADKFLNGDLNENLRVKCHDTNPQHRQFVSRRWREIKQEFKEWDL